jgi:hypothetical protein
MGRPFHPDDPILPARGHISPAAARAGYRTDVGYPVVTAHGNDALQ